MLAFGRTDWLLLDGRFYSMVSGHLDADDGLTALQSALLSDLSLIIQDLRELPWYTTRWTNCR